MTLPKLYSGAADGSDSAFMKYAEEFSFPQQHFIIHGEEKEHCKLMQYQELKEASPFVQKAAKRLGKNFPRKSFVWKLIHRNWFQVKDSDAVFAIGTLSTDLKNVNGGTGWAVAMAIECTDINDIYAFDQDIRSWFKFDREEDMFYKSESPPKISASYCGFAGIGTRKLAAVGEEEIKKIFLRSKFQ